MRFWCADGQAEGRGRRLPGKAWWAMEVWAARIGIGFERGRLSSSRGRDREALVRQVGGGECIQRAEPA